MCCKNSPYLRGLIDSESNCGLNLDCQSPYYMTDICMMPIGTVCFSALMIMLYFQWTVFWSPKLDKTENITIWCLTKCTWHISVLQRHLWAGKLGWRAGGAVQTGSLSGVWRLVYVLGALTRGRRKARALSNNSDGNARLSPLALQWSIKVQSKSQYKMNGQL